MGRTRQEVKTSFNKYGDIIKTRKTEKGINVLNFSASQRILFKGFSKSINKLKQENKTLKEELKEIKHILKNHNLKILED